MYNKVLFPALERTNTSPLLLSCSHWENLFASSFLFKPLRDGKTDRIRECGQYLLVRVDARWHHFTQI